MKTPPPKSPARRRAAVRKPRLLDMPFMSYRVWSEAHFAIDSDLFSGTLRLRAERARRLSKWLAEFADWSEARADELTLFKRIFERRQKA